MRASVVVVDSTWPVVAPQLESCLVGRGTSLFAVCTDCVPRVTVTEDPLSGLASVEALFLARLLIGQRDDSLLEAIIGGRIFSEDFAKRDG